MSTWAMIPIKPLNRAKSRLAPVLSEREREFLALEMLYHNLRILTKTPGIDGVLVISRDMKALSAARTIEGVQTMQESGTPELNSVLHRACRMLISWQVEASLIMPADIPLVTHADIANILALGHRENTIVIAPDRHKDGTNAILTRPPDIIDLAFGTGSFAQHIRSAELTGAEVLTYESVRLGMDIDTPDDLDSYYALAKELGVEPIQLLAEAAQGPS